MLAVAGIADQAHDLKAIAAAFIRRSLERLSDRILAVEELLREGLVDDRGAGRRVAGAEVSAVDEGNLHRVQPAGRDVQKVGQNLGREARR